ncbi:MAG: hypothetical protein WCK62_05760 [Actinomycetes bacterium]
MKWVADYISDRVAIDYLV